MVAAWRVGSHQVVLLQRAWSCWHLVVKAGCSHGVQGYSHRVLQRETAGLHGERVCVLAGGAGAVLKAAAAWIASLLAAFGSGLCSLGPAVMP